MNKEEIVKYLANVYAVVVSDGVVDRVEEKVFEKVASSIGGGYFEQLQAKEMVEGQSMPIQLDLRWSDKIRNLEDMMLAGYCNGVLDIAEKQVIVKYAGLLDISQKQLNAIDKEAKIRCTELK